MKKVYKIYKTLYDKIDVIENIITEKISYTLENTTTKNFVHLKSVCINKKRGYVSYTSLLL